MATNNKLIAKNTMMLYFRMFLVIAIQLYTVPIILKTLDVENYGIYNVVAGVVTMFTFVNGSLSSGTQRFFAYAMGQNDKEGLKKVFNANITVYGLFSILSVILLEAFCVWFLNNKMVIPKEKLWAANWVLQLAILQFAINLMTTTFNAAIIAHEKMNIYAYISILDCILKLVVVFLLQISPMDLLITYAILQTCVIVLLQIINQVYCYKHFEECRRYTFQWDKTLIGSLLSYAGFNVIGSIAGLLSNYGVNIIQNLFFGPILNAAHSISSQISGVLSQFTFNVRLAVRPQIVKNYAAKEIESMWKLMFQSGKLTFYLFIFISVPLLIELPYILDWWLDTVPDHTVIICRMMIISLLINTISAPLNAVFQAANKLKHVQLYSAAILLFIVPASYITLLFYKNVLVAYSTTIGLNIVAAGVSIIIAKYDLDMSLKDFCNKVVFKCALCLVMPFFITFMSVFYMKQSFIRLIISCIISTISSVIVIWLLGLNKEEKNFVVNFIKKKLHKN